MGPGQLWLGRGPAHTRVALASNAVSYVARSDGSRGTYVPSPPLILGHLENWDGRPGSSAPALAANALSLTLPLMLLCLLLAADVLRTAFPHQRSGKILISGVG